MGSLTNTAPLLSLRYTIIDDTPRPKAPYIAFPFLYLSSGTA